jgi:long-chain acyl-CoA synthetase
MASVASVPESRRDEPARPWLGQWPPGIPREVTVPNLRLPDAIWASVRGWPKRTALEFYGARWSYQELWEASGRVAAGLHRGGMRAGDRVALYLPNCPSYPIAFLGALRLGLAVVPVSPLALGEDLVHLLGTTEPSAIVTLDILYPNVARVSDRVPIPRRYVAGLRELYPSYRRPFLNRRLRRRGLATGLPSAPGVHPWGELLRPPAEFPAPGSDPATEVAVLQGTGGTTGTPKAAMLTHRNLLANALQCQAWFSTERPGTTVLLASIPLTHAYGMTMALTYPLLNAGTIVLQLRPEAGEMLRLIARHRPTQIPGVPTLYRALADHPEVGRYDVRSVRICISGSAPLPAEVQRRFESITGGRLVEGYGLTEASPVTHINPIDRALRRAGSIGLPLPSTDQKVVDLETGTRTLGAGEAGELAVRGPQVMLGYYRDPAESALVRKDGWLLTGDVAILDADGYAFIVDRKKDMIDVGGLKVYPREVEEVLYTHPAILEAAVVGVPDERLGEVVRAFVVPKPGATVRPEEVIAFVRERIAHYKAPRSVEVRDALPRSPVQKVMRRSLREESVGTAPTRR